jgi:hypothetical protein
MLFDGKVSRDAPAHAMVPLECLLCYQTNSPRSANTPRILWFFNSVASYLSGEKVDVLKMLGVLVAETVEAREEVVTLAFALVMGISPAATAHDSSAPWLLTTL